MIDIRIPPRTQLMRHRGASGLGLHSVVVTPEMGRETKSRHALKPLSGRQATMPAYDSPAITEGRTIYTSTVQPADSGRVLKSAFNQAKIGGRVLKGKWKGMPVFSVTLEERKTCPTDCALWRACMGNHMHLAVRFAHGAELERKIRREVRELAAKHPGGFVVRLHILGDFYSVEYVRMWAELLDEHPELRIYGYSARWKASEDPIARALLVLAYNAWDRFALRFSNAPIDSCSTITIEHVGQKPADAIICPAELGKTESCSTCALCWGTERRIAFLRH